MLFSELENNSSLDEFKLRDATIFENKFPMKGNINNNSSLIELNEFELSSISDVPVPSLLSGRDTGTDGNLEVPMVHGHQDHHMEDAMMIKMVMVIKRRS